MNAVDPASLVASTYNRFQISKARVNPAAAPDEGPEIIAFPIDGAPSAVQISASL